MKQRTDEWLGGLDKLGQVDFSWGFWISFSIFDEFLPSYSIDYGPLCVNLANVAVNNCEFFFTFFFSYLPILILKSLSKYADC
jgi:hypothetical protein